MSASASATAPAAPIIQDPAIGPDSYTGYLVSTLQGSTETTFQFFERRGTSLSGRFLSIDELAKDVDSGKLSEPWSVEILRHLLPEINDKFASPKLI